MKNLLLLFVLIAFFACKRDEKLPLRDLPGRVVMQDNLHSYTYTIQTNAISILTDRTPLRWSHDGARLAVVDNSTGLSFYSILNANTLQEMFRFPQPNISALCWSPDDRSIAYTSDNTLVYLNLENMHRDTVSLPDTFRYDGALDWSPDGNTIVFAARGKDLFVESAICTMRKDGTQFTSLASGPFDHVRWSPDGQTIAFDNIWSVMTIRPDGSNLKTLIENAASPCWSAGGNIIMYTHFEFIGLWDSKISLNAREIDGDQRERRIYDGAGLIDWYPVE